MDKIDWSFLISDTRARVYLYWLVTTPPAFVATHYFQMKNINALWFAQSAIGLFYMYKVMPIRVRQMRNIFLSWLVPIIFGMAVSGLVFYIDQDWASQTIVNLGVFWLVVMAIAYGINGVFDRPSLWYWFAVIINILAAVLCYWYEPAHTGQYLISAIVTFWSMFYLWIFRTA